MKSLLIGIVIIVVAGVGGLVYRNALEHPNEPIACPVDAKLCPDGTSLAREGASCQFPACPPPNVSFDAIGLAFAVPAGFSPLDASQAPGDGTPGLGAIVAAYEASSAAPSASTSSPQAGESADIVIRQYPITASSTALATIEATAIGGASGTSVPTTDYSSTNIAGRQYTVVAIERFEGVVDTAYYLARPSAGDVLRFDAVDRGVDWTNPDLDLATLPAAAALHSLLSTIQGS